MIATHGVDISAVPSLPGQGLKSGTMHGASWNKAAPGGVSSPSVPAEPGSRASEWQSLLASLGMVGNSAQETTSTDSPAISAGTAQSLSGESAAEKSGGRLGSATVTVLTGTEGAAVTAANETSLLASVTQPSIASAKTQVQAFGADADSTNTNSHAKAKTAETAHEARATDPRKEAKKDSDSARTSQVEAAVQAAPVLQAAVLPASTRTESALISTPNQSPLASQAAETDWAAAASSAPILEKTEATSQAGEKQMGQSAAVSSIPQFENSHVARNVEHADECGGAVDGSTPQTGQGADLPQIQAAKKEAESASVTVQHEAVVSLPVSNSHSSLYPVQREEPVQLDTAASLPETVSATGKASVAAVSQPELNGSGRGRVAQATHLSAAQSTSPANEAISLGGAQNLSEVHAGAANGGGGASSPNSVQAVGATVASKEPFAAMDSGSGAVAPTWIHAGGHHAEAGFQDSTLGWVGVRAQVDGSAIRATLVPGSVEAAQSLAGHLAGLKTFLAGHHTPVETLTLGSPESRWAGHGMEQGSGQQTGQHAGQGDSRGQETGYSSGATGPVGGKLDAAAATGDVDVSAPAAPPGGVYISVMA